MAASLILWVRKNVRLCFGELKCVWICRLNTAYIWNIFWAKFLYESVWTFHVLLETSLPVVCLFFVLCFLVQDYLIRNSIFLFVMLIFYLFPLSGPRCLSLPGSISILPNPSSVRAIQVFRDLPYNHFHLYEIGNNVDFSFLILIVILIKWVYFHFGWPVCKDIL